MTLPTLKLLTPGLDFVKPYIIHALSDVYEITVDADAEADTSLAIVRENDLGAVDEKVINTLLITPDAVIGTGMNGLGRRLAEGIANGRMYHIKGNEARVSTVHATALAEAARITAGTPGRYVVADREPVSMDALIEALATRINGRRVYTLGPRWAWWLMPPYLRRLTSTDSVVQADFHEHFPQFAPIAACEYLTTHDYTDDTI